eukprot:scaffold497492_cov43-Prasinocladus_malaysianus.AAC.1
MSPAGAASATQNGVSVENYSPFRFGYGNGALPPSRMYQMPNCPYYNNPAEIFLCRMDGPAEESDWHPGVELKAQAGHDKSAEDLPRHRH